MSTSKYHYFQYKKGKEKLKFSLTFSKLNEHLAATNFKIHLHYHLSTVSRNERHTKKYTHGYRFGIWDLCPN